MSNDPPWLVVAETLWKELQFQSFWRNNAYTILYNHLVAISLVWFGSRFNVPFNTIQAYIQWHNHYLSPHVSYEQLWLITAQWIEPRIQTHSALSLQYELNWSNALNHTGISRRDMNRSSPTRRLPTLMVCVWRGGRGGQGGRLHTMLIY